MTSNVSPEESQQRLRMEFGAPLVGDTELHLLQRLCTGPVSRPSIPLGLLVAGTIVRGRLASPEDFGSHLDTCLKAIADDVAAGGDEGEEASSPSAESVDTTVLERLGEVDFRRRAEQWRTEDERVDGALQKEDEIRRFDMALQESGSDDDPSIGLDEPPYGAISDEYERWRKASMHLATEPVLTLTDATVLAGGQWVGVGMVRVLVREVGAWWLGAAPR